MLQDVAGPSAFLQPLQKAAALAHAAAVLDQAGQPGCQTLGEPGQGVGGTVFQLTYVDQRLKSGAVGPDIWTPQISDLPNDDIALVHDAYKDVSKRLLSPQKHD
jgi:hypothetical protein